MIFKYTVPGRPTPQERRIHIRGQWAFDPPKSRAAKKLVRLAALAVRPVGYKPSERAFVVECVFYGPHWGADCDNLLKLQMDAIKGVFWKDDHQVIEIVARKERCEKGKERTEVSVTELVPKALPDLK